MGTTIWIERPATRTKKWYQQIERQLREKNAIFLTPDHADLHKLSELLVTQDKPVLGGDCILTISHWLNDYLEPTKATAPKFVRLWAMHQALEGIDLQYFGPTSEEIATSRFLLSGVSSLAKAGITYETSKQLAHKFGRERELDLALAYKSYETNINELWNLQDPYIHIRNSIQSIIKGEGTPLSNIIIDGAFGTTLDITTLAKHLSDSGSSVHAIKCENREEKIRDNENIVSADELITNTIIPRVSCAANIQNEARFIANEVLNCIEDGCSPDRIAVFFADSNLINVFSHACWELGLTDHKVDIRKPGQSVIRTIMNSECFWDSSPHKDSSYQLLMFLAEKIEKIIRNDTFVNVLNIANNPLQIAATARELNALQMEWQNLINIFAENKQSLHLNTFKQLIQQSLDDVDQMRNLKNHLPFYVNTLHNLTYGEWEHTFLLGCTESAIPTCKPADFFNLASSHINGAQQIQLAFPTPAMQLDRDHATWHRFLTCSQNCTISYSQNSPNGKEQFPSHFINTLQDSNKKINLLNIPFLLPAVANNSESIAKLLAEKEMEWSQECADAATENSEILLIKNPEVQAHIKERYKEHVYSVTELQAYAESPFKHYAKYLLGLRLPLEEGTELDHLTSGSLVHSALSKLYEAHQDELINASPVTIENNLSLWIDNALASASAELAIQLGERHPAMKEHSLKQMHFMISRSVEMDRENRFRNGDNALTVWKTEWDFGSETEAIIRGNQGTIKLRGRIDRVDYNDSTKEMLVVDYKSGKEGSIVSKIKSGHHLQIPLYILVAQQTFPDVVVVGGLLFFLRSADRTNGMMKSAVAKTKYEIDGRKATSLKDDKWNELLSLAAEHAVGYSRVIESGKIPLTMPLEAREWDYQSRIPGTERKQY